MPILIKKPFGLLLMQKSPCLCPPDFEAGACLPEPLPQPHLPALPHTRSWEEGKAYPGGKGFRVPRDVPQY